MYETSGAISASYFLFIQQPQRRAFLLLCCTPCRAHGKVVLRAEYSQSACLRVMISRRYTGPVKPHVNFYSVLLEMAVDDRSIKAVQSCKIAAYH